jgi:hypothetical protein
MTPRTPSPWPLLLSKLRQAHRAVVTHAELQAAGLDPAALLGAHLIERVGGDRWTPPGCEHCCTPSLDFETRREERLVGVACPYEPSCWPGVRWYPSSVVEIFACSAGRVFEALRGLNGLSPLSTSLSPGVVPVGVLERRGMRVPVVWMLQAFGQFPETSLGLRQKLGGDGLIVLLSRAPKELPQRLLDARVAVLELLEDRGGDLHLHRALDLLDPRYRERRVEDPSALFEEVRIEFAEEPGARHIVRINGHEYKGFQKSDVKFARLLLLAAARARDPDITKGGWVDTKEMHFGKESKRDLAKLKSEMCEHGHPELSAEELYALIKSDGGATGKVKIRLAVLPWRIAFDESLRGFKLLSVNQKESQKLGKRLRTSERKYDRNIQAGLEATRLILKSARELGAPLPEEPVG